jgi:predicted hydrolase (HD superfamily)
MSCNVSEAHALAAHLLSPLEDRWTHTQAVAKHARHIAPIVGPQDYDIFLCAAWLLDIGYAPTLRRTGWHRLDGATYLRDNGWPDRLAALVAHHCEAATLAGAWGLDGGLAEFAREDGVVADALVHADMMSGPGGARISLKRRLEDLERPQPHESDAVTAARTARRQPLLDAVTRTERRLQALGHSHSIA